MSTDPRLRLRLTSEGREISDTLNYRTSDRGYDNVLRASAASDR